MKENSDFISVIMPVYNAREYLVRTLPAIKESDYPHYELIVVDCSCDGSFEFARKFADIVISIEERMAPGKARNRGVEVSKGSIVLFVDADVKIKKETLSQVARAMRLCPDAAALFGSYDSNPSHGGFFSQYKNLFNHYVHQNSSFNASSFWAGCGAVRKNAFIKAGGFSEHYSNPSIEDVDFGCRLIEKGEKIVLLKDLQVTHLKRWSFFGLLKTDIIHRAIPWTKWASRKGLMKDLNFKISDRVSGVLACVLFLSLIFAWCWRIFIPVALSTAGLLLFLNRKLYNFFLKTRGSLFVIRTVIMHWFYLLYSSIVFGVFLIYYKVFCKDPPSRNISQGSDNQYWDKVAQTTKDSDRQDLWRCYSKEVHLDLMSRWQKGNKGALLLKTDLYDEAVSDHGFMQYFSQQDKRVIGMDISFEVAREAYIHGRDGKGPRGEAVVTDIRNMPFQEAAFDEIISNSTLDHFCSKNDISRSLSELYRVLKPGGALIVTLDNPVNPAVFLRNILPYKMLKSTGVISYYMGATLSKAGLVRILESCGFRVSDTDFILHAPRLAAVAIARLLCKGNSQKANAVFCKFLKVFEVFARTPLSQVTGSFVAVKAVKQ